MSDQKLNIGLTLGDINGIGPEVVLRGLKDPWVRESAHFTIYGNRGVLSFYKKMLKLGEFEFTHGDSLKPQSKVHLVEVVQEKMFVDPGKATKENGQFALDMLDRAVEDLKASNIDGLVTGPLNKSTVKLENGKFSGQTEYITNKADDKKSMMLMLSEHLKLGLVTNHLPLKNVSERITPELVFDKIGLMHHSLSHDFLIHRPQIAVLGLNPHAGDNGLLGTEELDMIVAGISRAKEKGWLAHGPYPADGFFGNAHYRKFDGVLAMYHDQGLVPFKTLSFGEGVNYTAGLKMIRTSPDHGTAYDIAGKGKASIQSFKAAVKTVSDIIRNREEHDEMRSNPVKPAKLRSER